MTEWNDNEQRAFDALTHPDPPDNLEDRTVRTLQSRGLLGTSKAKPHWPALLRTAAVLGFGLGMGYLLRGSGNINMTAHDTITAKQYLLLLRGGEEPEGSSPKEIASEYANWARDHGSHVVAGEELEPHEGVVLRGSEAKSVAQSASSDGLSDQVAGYFVVTADDIGRAQALASTCPHIKYGGSIELRPIRTYPGD